jgi:O-antigen/teichoic acid export membrane protein
MTMATSVVRIPILVNAIGGNGYGVLLILSAVVPWLAVLVNALTNLTRVTVAEEYGKQDHAAAAAYFVAVRRSARVMAVGLCVVSVAISYGVPWQRFFGDASVASLTEVRLSLLISGLVVASTTAGAVRLGAMQVHRRVGVSQSFIGYGAAVSLVATVAAWKLDASFLVFVLASNLPTCVPFWLGWVIGRRDVSTIMRMQAVGGGTSTDSPRVHIPVRKVLIMSGAAAPPLYSTGLDPIVLGLSIGPAAVASYGLATRIGVFGTLIPSALYPMFWSKFAMLRGAGDRAAVLAEYRKELRRTVLGTTGMSVIFVVLGPEVAALLGNHSVGSPLALYLWIGVLCVLTAVQAVTLPVISGASSAPKVAAAVYGLIIPNAVLSYVLSKSIGVSGPIVASCVATVLLLGICATVLARNPGALVVASSADPTSARVNAMQSAGEYEP